MLLSMYLLYRFARSGKSLTYLFDVGLFVVLISLVSAFVPATQFVIFSFPVSFLSFPFYLWSGELAAPAALRNSYPWLPYHSVRFLTVNLNLTPDWALSGGGIAAGPEFYTSAVVVAFWVLFLANVLGGVIYFAKATVDFVRVREARAREESESEAEVEGEGEVKTEE